jgi:DNA polymerase-3 subunit alpha
MGKKDAKVMQAQRQQFLQGAKARKVDAKKAAELFDLMEAFAGYGFNKSHSTTYALVAYHTAYLKANYPAHFMAALLTIESQNTAKLALYLGECRALGVPVLPPDINSSELAFTVTPDGVRFGLGAVKNVGEAAALALIDARRRAGGVRSLYRLCEQLDSKQVNRRVFESLVKAGALDSLAGGVPALAGLPAPALRSRLFSAVEKALEHGTRSRRDRDQGQTQLFAGFGGGMDEGAALDCELPDAPAWTEAEQLAGEKESLGLYWSGHPIERYLSELQAIGARSIADLTGPDEGGPEGGPPAPRTVEVTVGGIIGAVRPLKTRKGDRMAAFALDDLHGSLEVVAFAETFAKAASLIQTDSMVLVKGKFERDEETSRLMASEIVGIDVAREKAARQVAIRLAMPPHGRKTVEGILDVLARHKGDRKVVLELELRGGAQPLQVKAEVLGQTRVKPSSQLIADLERVCGAGTVVLR